MRELDGNHDKDINNCCRMVENEKAEKLFRTMNVRQNEKRWRLANNARQPEENEKYLKREKKLSPFLHHNKDQEMDVELKNIVQLWASLLLL
jgi:hypothetical protein